MTKFWLAKYEGRGLLERSKSTNLFWLLLLMLAAGIAILAILFDDTVTANRWGIGLLIVCFDMATLAALLFLHFGKLSWASHLTLIVLLVTLGFNALFERNGAVEADVYQAVTLYFLGLLALPAVGLGGRWATLWAVLGLGTVLWVIVQPQYDPRITLSVRDWDREFNPYLLIALYAAGAVAGVLLLIQNRRNVVMMQFDQEIIEATNAMLEQTVDERTQSLRTILDSSGQGLFTFRSDFLVEPELSRGCFDLYGRDIAGEAVDQLLFPQGSDMAREFRQGLELYFAGKSRAEVIFDLLEKETFIRGKAVELDYREAGPGRLLCVLTDVTVNRQLADRNRAEDARRTLVLKALGHKRFFAGLLSEAETLFGELRIYEDRPANELESRSLLARIHTFKGNCGFFGFSLTQEAAHDFEFAIQDSAALEEPLDYRDLSLDLKRNYYQELNIVVEALGRGWLDEAGGILIPRDIYDKVAKYVSQKFQTETHLIDVLEHFRKMTLRDLFSRFPYVAEATAQNLGKRIAPMEIEGGDLRIVPERLEGLVNVCVHLVNNMVDHGIEMAHVREAQGKPPEGKLKITLQRELSSVVLSFSDDGKGISIPEVIARAKEKGFLAPDAQPEPREALQLLFKPGFSTKNEATEVSGRGIGLDAVRAEAEKLGGRIEIHSKLNAGTTFEIILPLGVFANRRGRGRAPGEERRRS